MLGIQLMLVAGVFIALSNYLMRKSIDSGGTTKGFLVIQLLIVAFVAILLNPVRMGSYAWSPCMTFFGIAGGCVLALMMASLGRALETGPPGLTFATLNTSTVMPSIIMVLAFGGAFGYHYNIWNGLGSLLVVIGLFWAGKQSSSLPAQKKQWLSFVSAAFFLHVLFLVFLSWRALFINYPGENGLFLSFDMDDAKNQWFMPVLFLTAALIQSFIFASHEKRGFRSGEILYGILGGTANGIGTFFMIRATEVATHFEHAMIYPLFSVFVIILCNLWGQKFYKENIHWKAMALCLLGIFIGTINWSGLLA